MIIPPTLLAIADEAIEKRFEFGYWHLADMRTAAPNVRFWGKSGRQPPVTEGKPMIATRVPNQVTRPV